MSVHVEKREGKRKTSYRSQVIIKDEGPIVHPESKSFSSRREAISRGRRREEDLQAFLDDPGRFAELVGRDPD